MEELHQWMVDHFTSFPLFTRVNEAEEGEDPIIPLLSSVTEEGKKVERAGGRVFIASFRRITDPHISDMAERDE